MNERIVAYVGEADMYHAACVDDDDTQDMTPLFEGSEDLINMDTDSPNSCGSCLGLLVEDESPHYYPLARSITNLTVDYAPEYGEAYTRACSHMATLAQIHDENYVEMRRMMEHALDMATTDSEKAAIRHALTLTVEYIEQAGKWETIKLHEIDGVYRYQPNTPNELAFNRFTVDYFAEQTAGTCDICGCGMDEGWSDEFGTEYCDRHVVIV